MSKGPVSEKRRAKMLAYYHEHKLEERYRANKRQREQTPEYRYMQKCGKCGIRMSVGEARKILGKL